MSPEGTWQGKVSYGDQTPETPLTTRPDGSFSLDHKYDRPEKVTVFVWFWHSQHPMVLGLAEYVVD